MPTQITVDYPTEKVTIVPKTAQQIMREKIFNRGSKMEVSDHYTLITKLNQPQVIYVKQVARKIQEEFMDNDDYSLEQTGLTASAYQAKFKRAFNE